MRKLSHAELVDRRLTPDEAPSIRRHPVTVVLQDIRSMYNVGSIFRSADAFRIQRLVLTGYTPAPPRAEIHKTALGADGTVPWIAIRDTMEAIELMKTDGLRIFAVELTDSPRPVDTLVADDYPCALVLGNEISGVSNDVLAVCDGSLEIPMHGVKHSLNVAVAAGIAMYATTRSL